MRLLARREYSERELRQRLRSKPRSRRNSGRSDAASCDALDTGSVDTIVDDVVKTLRDQGALSNTRFIDALVRRRMDKGYGPMRIRMELQQHGIDDVLIDEALSQTSEYWLAKMHALCDRKFPEAVADRTDWNRRARFFASRGFPADLIYRVLAP